MRTYTFIRQHIQSLPQSRGSESSYIKEPRGQSGSLSHRAARGADRLYTVVKAYINHTLIPSCLGNTHSYRAARAATGIPSYLGSCACPLYLTHDITILFATSLSHPDLVSLAHRGSIKCDACSLGFTVTRVALF